MSDSSAVGTSADDASHDKKEEILVAQDDASNGNDVSQDIDPKNEVTGVKLLLIHISLCLCTFLVGLFDSIRDVGWYGASFMVALCASQPLAGKTYTLFSKKHTFLLYLFVFELGSLVCALAPTSNSLIVGRAVAGLGASGIFAGGLTILTTIVPLRKRPIWTGTWSSVFAIASIVGPVIGGALTQHVTWRWCFYINLPIGGAGAVIFFFLVHLEPAPTENTPLRNKLAGLDLAGFVLLGGAIVMLLLALQWGGVTYAWSSSIVIGLFVGAGVVLMLFIRWQIYQKDKALIPPRLFSINRNPGLICAASFFINGPFQLIIYWLPIWFQAVLGTSPTQSGVNYFPTVIADVLAAFIGSGIVMQLGLWNPFLLFGEAMVCLGGGLLSTLYPEISSGHWIGYQIFGGIGYSLASSISHLGMQASLPQDLVPVGASTLLSIISTSCAIFNAVGETVFQQRLEINLRCVVPSDVIKRIISVGATDIASVVNPDQLQPVVRQYSKSITQIFYIPAGAPVISFILVAGCKWISTKNKQSPAQVTERKDAV